MEPRKPGARAPLCLREAGRGPRRPRRAAVRGSCPWTQQRRGTSSLWDGGRHRPHQGLSRERGQGLAFRTHADARARGRRRAPVSAGPGARRSVVWAAAASALGRVRGGDQSTKPCALQLGLRPRLRDPPSRLHPAQSHFRARPLGRLSHAPSQWGRPWSPPVPQPSATSACPQAVGGLHEDMV